MGEVDGTCTLLNQSYFPVQIHQERNNNRCLEKGLQFQKYLLARQHLAMSSSDYSHMQDDGKFKDTWLGWILS